MVVFPLPASSRYSYASRFDASHQGTDIFAPAGTPVFAVAPGKAKARIEVKGGKTVYLEADDGITYFYGHLASWSLPLTARAEKTVEAGEQIGTVGTTGNAEGKPAHLHFQMRDRSLFSFGPTDPFPALRAVDTKTEMRDRFGDVFAWLLMFWALERDRKS